MFFCYIACTVHSLLFYFISIVVQ